MLDRFPARTPAPERALEVQLGPYRLLEAVLFGLVADRTRLSERELARRLGEALDRPTLTASTLRGWRAGKHSVPLDAFLATCEMARVHFDSPEVERVLDGLLPPSPAS